MQEFIGKTVVKISGKPFKSGRKVNTVKEVTINPNSQKPAFSFVEDSSVVNIVSCKLHKTKQEL